MTAREIYETCYRAERILTSHRKHARTGTISPYLRAEFNNAINVLATHNRSKLRDLAFESLVSGLRQWEYDTDIEESVNTVQVWGAPLRTTMLFARYYAFSRWIDSNVPYATYVKSKLHQRIKLKIAKLHQSA